MNDKALFQWSDDYRTGHKVIDKEHRHLFFLAQELADAIHLCEDNKYFIIYALSQLQDYTETHFRNEEKLMRDYRYEHCESHVKNHDRLLHQVEHLLEEFQKGKPVLTRETLFFLKEWLSTHILQDDLKLARLFRQA